MADIPKAANPYDLLNRVEDLDPELESHITEVNGLGPCIQHPLILSIAHCTSMNAMMNQALRFKKIVAEKSLADRNWSQYICIHERPYRIQALMRIAPELKDPEYWKATSDVWSDSENIWQYKTAWKTILGSPRECREHFMEPAEREFFNRLPPLIRVFRGHGNKNKNGASWSLSYTKAAWFAERFSRKVGSGCITSGYIRKADAIGLLLRRCEAEIVVFPWKVKAKQTQPALAPKTNFECRCFQQFRLPHIGSDHGWSHWCKVRDNGYHLLENLHSLAFRPNVNADIDRLFVHCFAMLHDCCRLSEMTDPGHGRRAAEFALHLAQDQPGTWPEIDVLIREKLMTKLLNAIATHTESNKVDDPLIAVCRDADRLDLFRVGTFPDPKQLMLPDSFEVIGVI